jgi:hypothetical protein
MHPAVSNERLGPPSAPGSDTGNGAASAAGPIGIGDEVSTGQGRSRVSLGVVGKTEMQAAFVHVYQQESAGSPERILLSYSAIFASGNVLSLTLPYVGSPLTFDAASVPIGGDGMMWSSNGEDRYSTQGTFRVERTGEGLTVHMSDLALVRPLNPEDRVAVDDGVIEGQLVRRCLLAKPREDGLTGPDGPVAQYEPDPTWTSEYCSQYR